MFRSNCKSCALPLLLISEQTAGECDWCQAGQPDVPGSPHWSDEDPCDCGARAPSGFFAVHGYGDHPDCEGWSLAEPGHSNVKGV
jgi:hypothetical protein